MSVPTTQDRSALKGFNEGAPPEMRYSSRCLNGQSPSISRSDIDTHPTACFAKSGGLDSRE